MRAAVIGHPVGHSLSPALHSKAYSLLGLEIDYGRIDAQAESAPTLAQRLRSESGWLGLSVTMPMKQPMLTQMDTVDPLAARLGALNTVVTKTLSDGVVQLSGYNTDVAGIVTALSYAAGGEENVSVGGGPTASDWTALVLGAGGTAAAALAALHDLGHVRVMVAVRSLERLHGLPQVGEALGLRLGFVSFEQLAVAKAINVGMVISTLPAGAADVLAPIVARWAAQGGLLLDVAYAQWPSQISTAWQLAGGVSVHGLAMLVHQAVEQVVLFTGKEEARGASFRAALCDEVGITSDGTGALHVAG